MNQSGGAGGSSRTGTITSTYRSGAAAANGASSAFDALTASAATLEKRSLAAADSSYDVFEAQQMQQQAAAVAAAQQQHLLLQQQQQQQQQVGQLGGHLSPGSQMTFADLHDVHYAPRDVPPLTFAKISPIKPLSTYSSKNAQKYRSTYPQPLFYLFVCAYF